MNGNADVVNRRLTPRQWWRLIVVVGLLLTVHRSLFTIASAQAPTVRFETPTQTFTVGDAVRLDLVVDHGVGQRVLPPSLEMDWGEIELQGVTQPEITLLENGMERTSIVVQVTAWEPGDYITPPFDVRLASADGTISTLSVQPFPLRVESVLNPDDLNARDIKPQATLPIIERSPLLIFAGIMGGIVIAVAALFFALGRRQSPAEPAVQIDNRPPHVIALAELDEIEQASLVSVGQFQQHYTRVSETVRRYLEMAFKLSAMEETTVELRRSLEERKLFDKETQKDLISLLQEADVVKFAKIRPNDAAANNLTNSARDFVKATHAKSPAEEQA